MSARSSLASARAHRTCFSAGHLHLVRPFAWNRSVTHTHTQARACTIARISRMWKRVQLKCHAGHRREERAQSGFHRNERSAGSWPNCCLVEDALLLVA